MPKALLDFLGYKFFFWSNENAEPPHVHVCRGKQTSNATKFWITADGIKLDHNKSQIPQNDLKKIARYILENRADMHGLIILIAYKTIKKFKMLLLYFTAILL
mgnify:CR=1 FL=1